jgi:hypothetical protein
MKCEICGETAVHHVTDFVDGRSVDHHVCGVHLAEVGTVANAPAPRTRLSPLWDLYRDARIQKALTDPTALQTLVAYLLPPLCEALRDRNADVRLRAALFLARLGRNAESAIGALRDALEDRDAGVKMVAEAAIRQAKAGSGPEEGLFVV